jgi:2-C-methyl-D-erythritol 4-phosphate cytidylyltransferase
MNGAVYAVVPAAGAGKRMGSAVPKQYLELAGRTVLEHTLWRLAGHALVQKVVVAVSSGDEYFEDLRAKLPGKIGTVQGGAERCHSVLSALHALSAHAAPDDWVVVHDAARPCVRVTDLDRMFETLGDHEVGGILAAPVRDTLKRCGADGAIIATVDRTQLWHALTPQMFRLGTLTQAIETALADGVIVTDEAQAIERIGLTPRVVAGSADNLKITHPEDLALAGMILAAQAQAARGGHTQ